MKLFFRKTVVSAMLCVLLATIILFSGCTQVTFMQSIKAGMKIEKYDFTATVSVTLPTVDTLNLSTSLIPKEQKIKITGTVNGPESMYADVSVENADESSELTTIIVKGSKIYIDAQKLTNWYNSLSDAVTVNESLFKGKTYVYVDINKLMEQIDTEDKTKLKYSEKDVSALTSLLESIFDVAETASVNVEPAVISQDGNNFKFNLSNKNIEAFLHNFANVLESQKDLLISGFIDDANKAGAEDLVKDVNENKDDYSKAYDEAVTGLKNFTNESLNGTEFDVNATSKISSENPKVWDFSLSGNFSSADASEEKSEFSLEMQVKENSQSKELPEVDSEDAISYQDINFMNILISNYSSDDEAELYDEEIYNYQDSVDVDTSKATGGMFDNDFFITINGKKLTAPIKFGDLLNAGLNYNTDMYILSYIRAYDFATIGNMYLDDENKYIYLTLTNETYTDIDLVDCQTGYLSALKDTCFDEFSIRDDINFNSKIEDVINKYGKDLDKSETYGYLDSTVYVWTSEDLGYTVELEYDKNQDEISGIYINAN